MGTTSIGDRLGWLARVGGASLREVDRLAGRTEGHAQSIVSGSNENPEVATVRSYAKALGCRVGWLLDGEGDPPAEEDVRAAVAAGRPSGALTDPSTSDGVVVRGKDVAA